MDNKDLIRIGLIILTGVVLMYLVNMYSKKSTESEGYDNIDLSEDYIDKGDESTTHGTKKVTTAIMQGRMAKKLTQANLAAALSLKVDIIRSYESGKAIPNNLILTKMQKILGVKLTGLNKGTKK